MRGAAAGSRSVSVTGVRQRDAWRSGALPPVEQVRPGIWTVPVPIPDNPLRYTLSYLFVGDDGVIVVDPGWDAEQGWSSLCAGLGAAGAAISDVTGVVATHIHADHHGLSARLRAETGAWVAMHPAEHATLPARTWALVGAAERRDGQWLRSCGVPADEAAALAMSAESMRPFLSLAEPDLLLADGDFVPVPGRRVRVTWTPGHTPGHICLHDEEAGVLLTGDHLLPRISPNVGFDGHDASLADYLESLRRLTQYDDAEALPAHEYRFAGIAARVAALLQHHRQRCAEIAAVVRRLGDATVWQVAQCLTWSRDWAAVTGLMRRAALGETQAHLRHMADRGELVRIAGRCVRWRLPDHFGAAEEVTAPDRSWSAP